MRISHALFRCALLGSTFAAVAVTQAVAAPMSHADWQRLMAATGGRASATQSAPTPGFHAVRQSGFKYSVLHSFTGGTTDGGAPTAEVTLDQSSNIWGSAGAYGADSGGVLFEIPSGGKETVVHSFGGTGDGSGPDGAVIFSKSGDMFGTTAFGGSAGNGTIWELTAGGTYSVLYNFTGNDGSFVRGRLASDNKGDLYGTALFGGVNGDGTVFEYSAKGKFKVLHAFDGTDGQYPEHSVVSDSAGNLYGVTAFGGADGEGAVYEITAKGHFSTLYSFSGGTDGSFLYGGLAIDTAGNLYGSTADGGADNNGMVFELPATGKLKSLYSFKGGSDVSAPEGDMLLVGKNLFSTATTGGDPSCQCGGVYEVTAKGKEKVLSAFTSANGGGYSAGVTAVGTKTLYGTTEDGGADEEGVVFSLTK